MITRPVWLQTPSASQFLSATPAAFLQENLAGRIVVNCQIGAGGTMGDCKLVSETPPNRGLVGAAQRLLPYYHMASEDLDRQPTAGRRYQVTISLGVRSQN